MIKHIIAIGLIFICTTIGWFVLGATVMVRSDVQEPALKNAVGKLWGTKMVQKPPSFYTVKMVEKQVEKTNENGKKYIDTYYEEIKKFIPIQSSEVNVNLDLEHRKKGLFWYSTYIVNYLSAYEIVNDSDSALDIQVEFEFPKSDGIYDNFTYTINDSNIKNVSPINGVLIHKIKIFPKERKLVKIAYNSQGMDEWWYHLGDGISQLNNYKLTMTTNFDKINFPEKSISPVSKSKTEKGWELTWNYKTLISGLQIGIEMPKKMNPGPFVSRVSFFAPVSLFFFFFIVFIITILKDIKLHPMNYFFLAAAFFAFHLLLAYLVDHINIHLACMISSIVSILLVISYMRLVIGLKFAFFDAGISQFVYLILFSYAFFLEGYTGLTITICAIITLFITMQLTGRIDWNEKIKSFKIKDS